MKNFIAKIKNRRLKGNVSLLVIFILLASSVIALLSINQIQRLLTYGNMTFNYFRAFYLAKAWTELGLTEVYYREAWFEQAINSWNAIVTENFWIHTGFNTHFTMNISWNFQYLTDDVRYTNECDEENMITLGTGEWIMLSLFKDGTEWINDSLNIGTKDIITLNSNDIVKITTTDLKREWWTSDLIFWLFGYKGDLDNLDMGENIVVETGLNLNYFLWNNVSKILPDGRNYLTIKNSWTENQIVKFCIYRGDKELIPYSDSLITVRGNYGDMEVWLQSVVKKEVPSWSLDVLWWPEYN